MLDAAQIQAGIDLFQRLLEADPVLMAELEASVRDFFRGAPADAAGAARRHLEWFLFERLGGPRHELGVERLLPRWRAEADEDLVEGVDTFLSSYAGIFRVGKVEAGRGAWLSDLAGLGEYPVEEPEASVHLEEGDLVIGRLFGVGDGVHRISPGAQLFRSPELSAAIERDLEHLREQRKQAVLRVAQIELETMFFGAGLEIAAPAGRVDSAGDPVGDARRLLTDGGVAPALVDAMLASLSATPIDPASLVHGVGDTLAEVLDRLAFESRIDLEAARVALLAAWIHMSLPPSGGPEASAEARPVSAEVGPTTPAPARAPAAGPTEEGETDPVQAALDRFAESRRAGADLEGCFDALERDLGLVGDSEEDDVAELPDFPGVVGAMIEEFVWERGLEGVPTDAPEYDILRRLGGFTEEVGVIENLQPNQVLGFAALWLPDRVEFEDDPTAGRAVRALRGFVDWLAREHAIDLGESTTKTLEELEAELPRVTAVNRRLATGAGQAQAESWFEVAARDGSGAPCLSGPGGLQADLPVDEELVELLAPGDWLRFELDAGGQSRPVRCFPAQASSWLAHRQTSRS